MAQVKVQVVVDRKQVDELSAALDKINGKKLNVSTRQVTDNIKQTEKATRELLKTEEAQQKLAQQREKTAQQILKTEQEAARAQKEKTSATKSALQVEKEKTRNVEATTKAETAQINKERALARQQRETASAQKESTKATKEGSEAVKKQGLLYDILGRSVSSFIARMTIYRAVYAGIRAITNGFTEALQTLKEVDDELVTVRKVTGFDEYQMADVEKNAYAVASKYGSSAADYTASVAEFARAGYKDLSNSLAELAQKTIIVGDTTGEVANQFLIAVDKAYKYEGSVQKLAAVLDGVNELDNKFATSTEKIAEGMGIVAPVAAQMHVQIDELAASIGTITAVTQRSGTEAARALRAIYLNIIGDTKTEIEEGVTWTTGEIEGLRDVIKLYAKDAWDAAQESKGIIDPMEAIAGLAKSVKDGVLSEAKLMEMVSDIGGKLRTSQLLALINNWDMYEQMLDEYRNAYGSADKEIENAMDSWTRKANVLKNTWTEFVKTGINSDFFKGALDTLTAFVQRLGTLPGLLARIGVIVLGLKLPSIITQIGKIGEGFKNLITTAKGAASAATAVSGLSAAITALGIAWSVASYIIEDAKRKHEALVQSIYEDADAAKDSNETILELYANFNSATEGSDELTESAQKLADALGREIPEGAENAIEALKKLTAEQMQQNLDSLYVAKDTAEKEALAAARSGGSLSGFGFGAGDAALTEMWHNLREKYYDRRAGTLDGLAMVLSLGDLNEAKEYRAELEKIVSETEHLARINGNGDVLLNTDEYRYAKQYLADTAEAFEKLKSAAEDYDLAELKSKFLDLTEVIRVDSAAAYDRLTESIRGSTEYTDEQREILISLAEKYYPQYVESVGEAEDAADGHTGAVGKETDALRKNQAALDDTATAAERAAAAKKDAEAAVAQLIPVLFDETGALTDAGKAAIAASQYLADLAKAELDARNEAAQANYANLQAQLAGVAASALKAAYALVALEESYLATGVIDFNEARRLQKNAGQAYYLLKEIQALESVINSTTVSVNAVAPYTSTYKPSTSTYTPSSSSSGSSGGSSSSSTAKTEDETLNALKNELALRKSELSLMQARGDSEEKQIAKIREIQSALKKEWEYLQSIEGGQITINGLYEEWYEYNTKISNIQESLAQTAEKEAEEAERQAKAYQDALAAQIALQNVLKNRSVRIFNRSTGQWEWQANPSDAASARDAANNALSQLSTPAQRSVIGQAFYQSNGFGNSLVDFLSRISGGNSSSTNNYGNTYNFGGLTIPEAVAKTLTVFDLAKLSASLPIYA